MSTRFVGLDLAWSSRNNTAAVAIEAQGRHADWIDYREHLSSDEEVVAFVRQVAGEGSALVAIDAPLIVPNEEGARPVDREITHLFGRYGAGCYPANRRRPGGCQRGAKIVAALAQDGFVQDPSIQKRGNTRSIFEVYPHPATITLFHLNQTLKYKARPQRSLDSRRSELARLRAFLRGLALAEPAMSSPEDVMTRNLGSLAGSGFKRYEDLLDSALCAYIAYHAWYWGPVGYQVHGDTTYGYILVPSIPSLDQETKSEYSMLARGGG